MTRRLSIAGTASFWLVLVAWSGIHGATATAAADEREDFFEKQVRPLLLDNCIKCHGPSKQENHVRLDRRNDVLQGKASDVPLIKAGIPQESRLFKVLQHAEDDIAMPPAQKLSDVQLAVVRQWIADGAVWPESANLEADARRRQEAWRAHWAFQPVTEPDLSQIPPGSSPIDYLILQKLSTSGLDLSKPAAPATLVRRWSFALHGLPPEAADLQAAAAASSEVTWDAWKTDYVNRLLNAPQFGERWGRYWLDVARYADTKGYVFQEDRNYPDAWRYREWVINSINQDMPYAEFLKRQLAADRLPGADDPAQLAAMGFLTLGRRFLNNPHDIIDDRIDVVSRGMLGLTTGCARCHDHKFDPIPTADYYSLYGIFASSDEPKNEPSPLRLVDRDKPVEPVIFERGNPANRGAQVPRRFLTALSKPDAPNFADGSGRLELANAIAERSNPVTGRVAVNRVWMRLFGQGFVDAPSDFGVRTPAPTHPELLDYLTWSFMEHEWSLKSLIREIVLSATWQQSSAQRPDADRVDPERRLLAGMRRTRLDFEAHRDAVLKVSARLDATVGGPSADIAADPNNPRRTIYARIDRQNLPGMFRTFDLPNPDSHAPRRFETTVPQQALFQLNNPFIMNRAVDIAELTKSVGDGQEPALRVQRMFQTVLQRDPRPDELVQATEFIRRLMPSEGQLSGPTGWQYGYGTIDDASAAVTAFNVFPWSGEGKWQGGSQLPDPALGWTSLHSRGGHPGGDLSRCAIRRWTADADCRVLVNVVVEHKNEQGDGVRFRAVSPAHGVLLDIVAFNETVPRSAVPVELPAGAVIDFVADCRSNESFDSFQSNIVITQLVDTKVRRVWKSEADFRDQSGDVRLDAWAQLAQTLLLTNEFVFVD